MVERDGLENRCGRMPTEGSNPSLSAITFYVFQQVTRICHTPCHTLFSAIEFGDLAQIEALILLPSGTLLTKVCCGYIGQ